VARPTARVTLSTKRVCVRCLGKGAEREGGPDRDQQCKKGRQTFHVIRAHPGVDTTVMTGRSRKLGVWMATAPVTGNILGTGLLMLPASGAVWLECGHVAYRRADGGGDGRRAGRGQGPRRGSHTRQAREEAS
jgi:hypothetical protein